MKKKFLYNFVEVQNQLQRIMADDMCRNVKDIILGKTIGVYGNYEGQHNNGMGVVPPRYNGGRLTPLLISKVKDVGFDQIIDQQFGITYYQYHIIDENDRKIIVNNLLDTINIEELLTDLNTNQPSVSFMTIVEEKRKKRNLIKKLWDKISEDEPFRDPPPYQVNKSITVKLKKIFYGEKDQFGYDKLMIRDDKNKVYFVADPFNISVVVISAIDPYGEEEWDD